jgi:hypothetical protein
VDKQTTIKVGRNPKMDKAKTNRARVEKVGVAWTREFKGGKKGLKISINKELFVAYENKKKSKDTDVDYVVCRFIDEK